MSRKKIVAGNWKMNCTRTEALELVRGIVSQNEENSAILKLLFPPFPYLSEIHELVKNAGHFETGAQNCSNKAKGAFTGEVSAAMIRSCGAGYVIIGHSERRQYFNERSGDLREKIIQALSAGLKVIYCFGELLSDRKAGNHFNVVETQMKEVLSGLDSVQAEKLVMAYEPVWAIGTGETASPDQAQEMHAHVRTVLTELFSNKTSEQMSVLYGGSCNAQNAKVLFSCPDVDGGLIGGASLKADEFCTIAASF